MEEDLIECMIGKIDTDEITAGGEDWLAEETADPFEFVITQWQVHDNERPTGPKKRVRVSVTVTDER